MCLILTSFRESCNSTAWIATSVHRTYRWLRARRGCPGRTCFGQATRAMVHRNFDQTIAGGFDQCGNKTMHSLERKHRAYAHVPHRFERATGVADPIFCVAAANSVGNPARRALYECVSALDPIAADKICAACNFSEEFRNIGGIIL